MMAAVPDRPLVVLDGAAVRRLAERTTRSVATIEALVLAGLWPATMPSVALVDCLSGDADTDRVVLALLGTVDVVETVPRAVAERAAWLRTAAGRGSAADAIVVALAEAGGGAVLTAGRRIDVEALALFAGNVYVERV